MIRHTISFLLALIINSSIFIFNKINYVFKVFGNKYNSFSLKFKNFYKDFRNVIREGLIALIICAIGDLFAGIILGNMVFFLETLPGLLIIIPGAIGLRGNIFGSLSSRLNTNLHIGILSPEFKQSKTLNENIFASIILTLVLSLLLPIIAKIICIVFNFDSIGLVDFCLISIFSGIISIFIMLPTTMFISLKSFENGWDPDNITTPLVTALGDLFTLPSLILAILIVFFLDNNILKIIILSVLVLITISGFIYSIFLKGEIRKIISQSTPILILSSCIGIFAGGFLNNSIESLFKNPTVLALIPLFSGVNGSMLSILSARLSSGLHSGLVEPILRPEKYTLYNFAAMFIFGIIIFPFIAILSEFSLSLAGLPSIGILNNLLIIIISGFIVISIMVLVIFYVSSISYRRGLDPDNIVIPISTSLTDFISNVVLIGIALIIVF